VSRNEIIVQFSFEIRGSYLKELRVIAINGQQLSSETLSKMRTAPILLGTQRTPRVLSKGEYEESLQEELDEEDWELRYDLKKPDQIVIADDAIGYQLFGDSIFTAPQEDLLEGDSTNILLRIEFYLPRQPSIVNLALVV
jgi:hypothetical protein